jgi:hypothetical protein
MHGWPVTKSSAVREGEQQQTHHQSATILLLGCLVGNDGHLLSSKHFSIQLLLGCNNIA